MMNSLFSVVFACDFRFIQSDNNFIFCVCFFPFNFMPCFFCMLTEFQRFERYVVRFHSPSNLSRSELYIHFPEFVCVLSQCIVICFLLFGIALLLEFRFQLEFGYVIDILINLRDSTVKLLAKMCVCFICKSVWVHYSVLCAYNSINPLKLMERRQWMGEKSHSSEHFYANIYEIQMHSDSKRARK